MDQRPKSLLVPLGEQVPVLLPGAIEPLGQEESAEQRLKASHLLLRALAEGQMEFIRSFDAARAFERLLQALLELTGSEYGFVGEVFCSEVGRPLLQVHAVRAAGQAGPVPSAGGQAGQVHEPCELSGALEGMLTTGRPLLINEPGCALALGVLLPGHPPSNCWLWLPLEACGEHRGLVGIANRPGGYHEALFPFLQPFLATCSSIFQAWRAHQQRLRAEEELRRNQERLSKLALVADRTHNAVVITDAQGRIEWVNEGFTRITGFTLHEVQGRKPGEVLQGPDTNAEEVRLISQCIREGRGFKAELLNYSKVGIPYWIAIEAQPVYDGEGQLTHYMAIESDITGRKAAEERLRQSEEELKRHRDHLEELVYSRTERLLQATRELEERQAQLIQSEKLASLGQMAAGVAHEINNPVAYVMSNLSTLGQYVSLFTQLLRLYGELEASVRAGSSGVSPLLLERIRALRQAEDLEFALGDVSELLQDSLEGTRRVKEIVQNLRTFARQDSGDRQIVDVNKGLETTLKMVWNELKYKCEVQCDYGQVPDVMGYPTQLNQVFMNLLLNAAQAIDSHGEIRISSALEGNEVVVRISDTGHGMTPETITKLFTPFFTTKPPGKGTGLGLSISYGIIARHDGRIEVQSEPGRGSTFSIHLPAATE